MGSKLFSAVSSLDVKFISRLQPNMESHIIHIEIGSKVMEVSPPRVSHVSPLLRGLFVVHFVADIIFAIPLFVAPQWTLIQFGWTEAAIDPLTTRLVACALFGIGIESLLGRNATDPVYLAMLNLKSIWSISACIAIAWSIWECQSPPWGAWAFLGIFLFFTIIWNSYRFILKRRLT